MLKIRLEFGGKIPCKEKLKILYATSALESINGAFSVVSKKKKMYE